jgi:hypothetical protein
VFARVARFEGLDMSNIDEQIAQMSEGGPPPGLEHATGFMQLLDREKGTALGIVFFADEDGLRRGDEALNAMNPPAGAGQRSGVDMYEVAIEMRNDSASTRS